MSCLNNCVPVTVQPFKLKHNGLLGILKTQKGNNTFTEMSNTKTNSVIACSLLTTRMHACTLELSKACQTTIDCMGKVENYLASKTNPSETPFSKKNAEK